MASVSSVLLLSTSTMSFAQASLDRDRSMFGASLKVNMIGVILSSIRGLLAWPGVARESLEHIEVACRDLLRAEVPRPGGSLLAKPVGSVGIGEHIGQSRGQRGVRLRILMVEPN